MANRYPVILTEWVAGAGHHDRAGGQHLALFVERATAKFTLGVTGGAGRFLPDRAQVYDVTTGWRLQDGEWMLVSASWKPKI